MKTLSSLPAPVVKDTDPLLPFEQRSLENLRAVAQHAGPRVWYSFLGLDTDPYQWISPALMQFLHSPNHFKDQTL